MREIIFKGNGETFSAHYEAMTWLAENGFSAGSSCVGHPIGVVKGRGHYIAKMRNMTQEERNQMDGLLYSGREGEARLVLKHDTPEQADSSRKDLKKEMA